MAIGIMVELVPADPGGAVLAINVLSVALCIFTVNHGVRWKLWVIEILSL